MISLRVTSLVLMCSMQMLLAERPCPPGFDHFRDSCYWFSNIKANFADARSYCDFLNSRLAVITSDDENDHIRKIAKNRRGDYFLGATNLVSEKTWMWEGGLEVLQPKWGDDQPDNNTRYRTEHCLELWSDVDYLWNNYDCSLNRNFICETCYHED